MRTIDDVDVKVQEKITVPSHRQRGPAYSVDVTDKQVKYDLLKKAEEAAKSEKSSDEKVDRSMVRRTATDVTPLLEADSLKESDREKKA